MWAEYYFFMKMIVLGGKKAIGKYALVDDEDFEYLDQWRWGRMEAGGYARTAFKCPGLKQIFIRMHQLLLRCPNGMEIDHKDGNPLNNQKSNLRISTRQQNSFNQKGRVGSSEYKGVSWFKGTSYKGKYYKGQWRAYIVKDNHQYSIGHFDNERHAAMAYDIWAKELFGEFARLNFK